MTEEEFDEDIEHQLETLIRMGLVERFMREDGEWVYAPSKEKIEPYDA